MDMKGNIVELADESFTKDMRRFLEDNPIQPESRERKIKGKSKYTRKKKPRRKAKA